MDLHRPEVTVTDPRSTGPRSTGPRSTGPLVPVEQRDDLRPGPLGIALLAAVGVVGAAVLVTGDVVRDRRNAVEQRRSDGVVDVVLAGGGLPWTTSHDPATGTGTVRGAVRLVNRGPRDVRVVGARFGDLRTAGAVLPAHDGAAVLVLRHEVRCPPDVGSAPPGPVAARLTVDVATPAGARQVVLSGRGLPLGALGDGVRRACTVPPLAERVRLTSWLMWVDDRTAVLQVDVANAGPRPVRLLSLVPARGLVVLSVDGEPARLPLLLPARTRRFPDVRTLAVRLGTVCGALGGPDRTQGFEELTLVVEEEDRSQRTSVRALALDPERRLRQLVGRTCPSG